MSDQPATKLYMALLSAAKDFGPVLKNANNPAFRTKYADLGAVLDAVTDPLANHGILLLQRFTHDQGGALLITELVHAESGQAIASVVPVVAKDPTDPQKMGGAITYYRRYSLLALLGLAPEDDDGNAASKPAPRPEIKRGKPEPYHEMHMVESAPAPRPTPPPAATTNPFTPEQFGKTMDRVWELLEDGKPYEQLVSYLNAARPSMTAEQKEIARLELPKLKAAIAERSAPAIAG